MRRRRRRAGVRDGRGRGARRAEHFAAYNLLDFWRDSGDRLFAFFGAAFCLLSLSWALLGIFSPTDETRPYIYAIRLVAFLLIIVGMIDKNRSTR